MTNTPKLSLEFEPRDIPWLFHALSIQKTTAMMCDGRVVRKRVDAYINRLKETYPILTDWNIDEYKFFEGVSALATASTWAFFQKKPRYAWEQQSTWGSCELVCDGLVFEITRTMTYNEEFVLKMLEFFKQVAPIDAQYIEHESYTYKTRESFAED